MAKSQSDVLFERLHANGLRKRVARDLSKALSKANGGRATAAASGTIAELRKIVADLEDRANGGSAKRQAASKKAAATRKRKANQRSAAAKKAAQTRARSSSTRSRSTSSRTKSRA